MTPAIALTRSALTVRAHCLRAVTAAALILIALASSMVVRAQTVSEEDQRALKTRIMERYDVVPLSNGVALRPKTTRADVRLIEISDTVAINGVAVSGRELRERLGADADTILRLSYLDAATLRNMFASPSTPDIQPERDRSREAPAGRDRETSRDVNRSDGERVRIFGDVYVKENERISGQ